MNFQPIDINQDQNAIKRKGNYVTQTVSKSDICPICGQVMNLDHFDSEEHTPYGRASVGYRELIESPEAYAGRIQLCHYACWETLPQDEKDRLNSIDQLDDDS